MTDAYVKGVSCPNCIEEFSAEDKARFAERQKQMQLARERGETHIGEGANGEGMRGQFKS